MHVERLLEYTCTKFGVHNLSRFFLLERGQTDRHTHTHTHTQTRLNAHAGGYAGVGNDIRMNGLR